MAGSYDVIVVGLGAMGSATAYHLAASGNRVLGIDRFTPPHTQGSSHGQTRIIREAYYEDPAYVPIVQRAYELWAELARESGRELFLQTGGLMIGAPEGTMVRGSRRSAETHHLRHQVLSASEVAEQFPALRPSANMEAVWEPRAGILYPELCVGAHLDLAARRGATLRYNEKVLSWRPDGAGARVLTDRGEQSAAQLVLTAGAWVQSLLPEWPLSLTVERQVLFWFAPAEPERFAPARCPIYLWEYAPEQFFYGFPDLGRGVKVAGHHDGKATAPDSIRREVGPEEVKRMFRIAGPFLPGLSDRLLETAVCMYTNTVDGHFLIDRHPAHPQVLVASPCSGHGFKFSSAIGEIVADLIIKSRSRFDLRLFRDRVSPPNHT